jgi:hypothetical protein
MDKLCRPQPGYADWRREYAGLDNFAEHVLYGVRHCDRLLNSPLDGPEIDEFRWGIAAVQEYACDAMWLDACGND